MVTKKEYENIQDNLEQLEQKYGQLTADRRILAVLKNSERATVREIEEITGVSKSKVRNFLQFREELGVIDVDTDDDNDDVGRNEKIYTIE